MSNPSTPQRQAAAELLLVSPIDFSGLALSSSKKRRITPTAEAASPKRIAIITNLGVVNPLVNNITRSTFPNPFGWSRQAELAHIDQRLSLYEDAAIPNPLFRGTPAQDLAMPPLARHITFPFDLRDKRDALFDDESRAMMLRVFPGTTGIGTDGWFLHILLRALPPKPWPLTFAGLPLHLTLENGPGPIPLGRGVSRKNGSIAEDQDGRDMENWEPLFHIVKRHFESLSVSITEVIYWGNAVAIVLKDHDTDFNKLPFRAAKIGCRYLFDDEMGRPPAPQARRLFDPAPGHPDDTQYDSLQPGLRVTSASLPDSSGMFYSTTTGVLLKDRIGNEFMTVASHGFPAECGTQVFHALPGHGRNIGELIMEVSSTEVALVKLRDTETFLNVTFQNTVMPRPIRLKKFVSAKSYRQFGAVCLDSPDTGFVDGQFITTAFQAIPSDDNSAEQQWIFTVWFYGGQDSAISLPEGMCGSAIWNEDGDVLGFFRYAPKEGVMKDWCAGIAADELIKREFELIDTSDRT